ncbi:gp53-like domain-containing protein [Escherichia coli]|uniref:gp53-like domain-containing protein n=1 Tax=Escherichia coli TaxID=562 RepID=UPI003989EE0C
MAKNDFKAFATDRNANVMSQEEWEALPALISGFTAGKASSAQVNKVIRQASFIAAALAQFVSDKTQRDVLDNGDLPGFVELLGSGFAVEYLSRKNPFGDIKSDGTVKTALENLGLGDIALAGVATGMLGNAGYVALPAVIGGVKRRLILQFGLTPVGTAGAGTNFTCTLPTAFPTAFQRVFLCHDNTDDVGVGFASGTVLTLSTFSFRPMKIIQTGTTLTGQNAPVSFHYLAIGYE